MSKPSISTFDLERIARVLFELPVEGNEPSFTTKPSDHAPACWDVIDAEQGYTITCVSEYEANQTADALNRLAEYWP